MHDRRTMLLADAAGIVVVASVAGLDPGGWSPFVVAKFALVSLAVVVAWWSAAEDVTLGLPRGAVLMAAGFVGVLALAAAFGRDPLYAWTGTPERHLGVGTWLLFVAAAAVGARLDTIERLGRFARWVTVAALLSGLYALIERWAPPIETHAMTSRLGGTYGSASFLGAASCLMIPVTVVQAAVDDHPRWRAVAATATALGVAALAGSGTRAAWLGIVVACVVVLLARRSLPVRDGRRWRLPAIAVLVGCSTLLLSGTGVVVRTNGGTSRIAEWAVGWRIVSAHPLLGVGPEGYRTALSDGVTPGYERRFGRTVVPDRAHNVLIDVAAAGGVVAALLFLLIIVCIAIAAVRAIGRRDVDPHAVRRIALATGVVGYLTQQMFLFPIATIDPVFWLLVGALVSVRRDPGAEPDRQRHLRWAAVPVAAGLLVVGMLGVAADRAARRALDEGRRAGALRAVELRPDVARYRLLASQLVPVTIEGLRLAVDDIEAGLELTPNDPILLLRRAESLTSLAISSGEQRDVHGARTAWEQLASAEPNCYRCHLGAGYAAALDGDIATSERFLMRAVELESRGTTEAADAVAALRRAGTDSGP